MSPEIQTIVAWIVVAVSAAFLVRPFLKKKKTPGCGGGCGCPSADFKAKLRS